ncbi:MAG: hypothetical protein ABI328_00680 [Gemmatimonadaceae bacterium]
MGIVFGLLSFFLWPAISVAGIGVGAYYAHRFTQTVERQGENRRAMEAMEDRIKRVEAALDESQRTIERIEAREEFTTRLLSERVRSSL